VKVIARSLVVLTATVAVAASAAGGARVAIHEPDRSAGGSLAEGTSRKGDASREIVLRGRAFGTTWSARIAGAPAGLDTNRLTAALDERLRQIDRQMSHYRPDSEVSRFNRARDTNWFAVSREVAEVVTEALRISRLTDGAFDVTAAPLLDCWGFGTERRAPREPDEAALAAAQARTGHQHLRARLDPPALRKGIPELSLDLSGIAKGFAAGVMAAQLGGSGLTNHLVEIGGEVQARGTGPEGRPWRVGIERPEVGSRGIQRVIELADGALATSGDYRNSREIGGRHRPHIIDPRTGRPVAHALASASVVHGSAMTADALATALMVLGPGAGFDLAARHGLTALLLVRDRGGVTERTTDGFRLPGRPAAAVHAPGAAGSDLVGGGVKP
jgi:thiamine biosynthesis lipoprotein